MKLFVSQESAASVLLLNRVFCTNLCYFNILISLSTLLHLVVMQNLKRSLFLNVALNVHRNLLYNVSKTLKMRFRLCYFICRRAFLISLVSALKYDIHAV